MVDDRYVKVLEDVTAFRLRVGSHYPDARPVEGWTPDHLMLLAYSFFPDDEMAARLEAVIQADPVVAVLCLEAMLRAGYAAAVAEREPSGALA